MDFLHSFSTGGFSLEALLKTTDLDRRVQRHVQKVYATLALALIVCGVGAYFQMKTQIGGAVTVIPGLLCLLGLLFTPSNPSTLTMRYGLLAGAAFFDGCSLGPLLDIVLDIHPPIVFTSLFLTFIVFASFSGAALVAKRRSMLYLASFCSIGLFGLMFLQLASLFFGRSVSFLQAELFLGLVVFSLYVLVDTQMLVERAAAGDDDHIKAALHLFLDFLQIFTRIMVILAQKEKQKKSKDSKRS